MTTPLSRGNLRGDSMQCLNCGNDCSNKYCSNHCQAEYQYKIYIDRWLNGLETGLRGKYQISQHIVRYLYEKHQGKCSRCGWNTINPYTQHCPLEVEHIDGNYLNNSPDNLDLICPNCHSLTATYKGANRGNGRQDRRTPYDNPELG